MDRLPRLCGPPPTTLISEGMIREPFLVPATLGWSGCNSRPRGCAVIRAYLHLGSARKTPAVLLIGPPT